MVDQEEMATAEVAELFGEPVPVEKAPAFPEEQIYAVSARVKNQATMAVNNNLTPVGVALCNTYTHVLMSLYSFANTLPDEHRDRMKDLIRSHERMPADFISSHQTSQPRILPPTVPNVIVKDDPEIERLLNLLEAARIPKHIPYEAQNPPSTEPIKGFWPTIVKWFIE